MMKNNLVKDWMTKDPITITENENLPHAHQIMKEHSIRRLPVVSNKGKLVGIVTMGDVKEASPSDATSLSIYELNYLLANLTIKDIMTKDPISIKVEDSLHDAAELMLNNKIGGIPVVDDSAVIGILTESDVFRAVMEIFE